METLLLFFFGAAFGSFLNVIATRYNPDRFLLSARVIGGRSHCTGCRHTLQWYELVPLVSFLALRGRCRACGMRLSRQYFIAELLSGLIFALVPIGLKNVFPFLAPSLPFLSFLWILVFATLLLIALIDVRLQLIPNEASLFLAFLGIILTLFTASQFSETGGSLLGSYALLFGVRDSLLINRLAALGVSVGFFGGLIAVTRGRGMGMGDLKLVGALALVFGWPDIILVCALAFIIGSLVALVLMAMQGKTMKSFVPFGPFLAASSAAVFFFGAQLMERYFSLFALS